MSEKEKDKKDTEEIFKRVDSITSEARENMAKAKKLGDDLMAHLERAMPKEVDKRTVIVNGVTIIKTLTDKKKIELEFLSDADQKTFYDSLK